MVQTNAMEPSNSTKIHYIPIEPLSVALRHPRCPCGTGSDFSADYLFHTDWLVVVPPHTPVRRAYFYDLGSTFFDEGVAGERDSLKGLLHKYRTFAGVEFDEIFAWEAKASEHNQYWKRVDLNMTHKLHFYNTPTSANMDDSMSALRMILAMVHPDDWVVFKLDIDNNAVEVAIILTILKTPALIARIDELIWEHHVRGSPTQWLGWGDLSTEPGEHATLESSYKLFTRLRQAGIRAHSWV